MNAHITRAAQIPVAKLPWQLNFVWWHPVIVGPQYATWFVSPFWQLEI
jgi:hypothetical protein